MWREQSQRSAIALIPNLTREGELAKRRSTSEDQVEVKQAKSTSKDQVAKVKERSQPAKIR